ncbi:MAG: hypothetical protein QOI74_637 [Micromonosporaceae bacterium]|nr:hypothetical protein [Micromonosporaceae bacterium]
MSRRPGMGRRGWAILATTVAGVALAGSVSLATGGAGASTRPVVPSRVHIDPALKHNAGRPVAGAFACQDVPLGDPIGRCYSPAQIQKAYDVSPLLAAGKNGVGRTIVIIDAFQDPYLTSELAEFDSQFGLPAADVTQIAPFGLTAYDNTDFDQVGWAGEIALDVQWAHAIAPRAKIVLALSPSDYDVDMGATLKYVVAHNLGDVISMSYTETEGCSDPGAHSDTVMHTAFTQATRKHITLVAGSGDSGAATYGCDYETPVKAVSMPNSDPNVTSVGGTNLNAADDGTYIGEAAWSDQFLCSSPSGDPGDGCSGGGFSSLWARPAYQSLANSRLTRGVPDVALNAGGDGGVLVDCQSCAAYPDVPPDHGNFWAFAGTSCGGPQWAGLVAIADQMAGKRLGPINPALYAIGATPAVYHQAFHDITHGNNRDAVIGNAGYDTRPNWDPVTGLGTPDAAKLLPVVVSLIH